MARACRRVASHAGFSIIEVLVAVSILAAAIGVVAQLAVVAARANTAARTATVTALLAAEKMEQLRGLTWGVDPFGQPIGDTTTDLTSMPPRAHQGVGLTPSPADALQRNTAGYCDFLDANGRALGGSGAVPPAPTVYARRWSIDVLPSSPNDTLVLQVVVVPLYAAATASKRSGASRLATLKTRASW